MEALKKHTNSHHSRSISGPNLSTISFIKSYQHEKLSTDSSLSSFEKLKQRKLPKTDTVDPHLAAKVVRNYLVPLFSHKFSNKNPQNSVVGDITLIEKLQSENESLRQELEKQKYESRNFNQRIFELESENKIFKQKISKYEIEFQFETFNLNQTLKSYHRLDKKLEFAEYHKEKAEFIRKNISEKYKTLSDSVIKERDLNNIRLFFHNFLNF